MQLTRFDRWLREKFVYQTHIHTLRPPPSLPAGVRTKPLPDQAGNRYKFLYVARSGKAADALIRQLKDNGQMYTTRIVDRDAWFVPLIAPKGKSLSWWLVSVVVIATSLGYGLSWLNRLVENPEFRQNFLEALEILKH